ncbi:MAG: DUF1353 domain-containing protein [Frankia sp.]|nr:DUF1353 domain-containing protein [Frankia sp.]
MPFMSDRVVVQQIDAKRWELAEPIGYQGRWEYFEVPSEFGTDFASVPRVLTWLLPRYGVYTRAAILHDYLWVLADQGAIPRVDADGLFRRALRELGVSVVRRWLMWAAVRVGAVSRSRSIKELWAGGPWQLLAILAIGLQAVVLLAVPVVVELVCLALFALLEWVVYLLERALRHAPRRRAPQGVSVPPPAPAGSPAAPPAEPITAETPSVRTTGATPAEPAPEPQRPANPPDFSLRLG